VRGQSAVLQDEQDASPVAWDTAPAAGPECEWRPEAAGGRRRRLEGPRPGERWRDAGSAWGAELPDRGAAARGRGAAEGSGCTRRLGVAWTST